MTDIDISPEAVDILIAVWEMGGLQQSELHLLTDTCRALSAALTQAQDHLDRWINTCAAQDQTLADMRVELTQSRAETAAAYERAAVAMGTYHWNRYASKEDGGTLSGPAVFTSHTHQHVERAIRALATPDQSSALAAIEAAAEARGMRKAAALARQALVDGAYIKRGSHQETPSSVMFLAETLVSNAILAAIPQGEV